MHTSQCEMQGNDWHMTALTCQFPLCDTDLQPVKETLLKMLMDQSTKKKKMCVMFYLKKGTLVQLLWQARRKQEVEH